MPNIPGPDGGRVPPPTETRRPRGAPDPRRSAGGSLGNLSPVGLQGFERRLEKLVEGVFARVFKSGLRPIELGRRLVREMDTNRSIGVRGRPLAPNHFTIRLNQADHDRFAEIGDSLTRELCEAAREHGRDEGYGFMGPISVELVVDPKRHAGEFQIDARMKEGPGGAGAGSLLLPNNDRYVLGEDVVVLGRLPDCDITLNDTNVSRRHAEIRAVGDAFVLVDLGSTNGSKVNGVRVAERELLDGDELSFGNIRLIFQAS